MPNKCDVLVVGNADRIEILSISIGYNITFTANYEEATERLSRAKFGHVITDAVLPDGKTGMDILRFMRKSSMNKSGHCATVCHTETSCTADEKKWNIQPSLSANFTFAQFHHGTIDHFLTRYMSQAKQCA